MFSLKSQDKTNHTFHTESNSSKTLILLETKSQVINFLQYLDEIVGEKIIIALSPFAMYELDKHGIPYKIPEEYYNPKELYEMGIENFQKIEDFCNIIDNIILKSCQSAKKRKITPALFNFFNLKVIYDSITVRIFHLSSIINMEKPDFVYIYNNEKYPFGCHENAPFIHFDNRESLYAQLMELKDWKVNVKILQSNSKFEKEKGTKRKKFILKNIFVMLLRYSELSDFARILSKRGIFDFFKWLKYSISQSEKCAIALMETGYNWDESIIELQAKQIGPIYRIRYDLFQLLNSEKNSINLETAWNEIQGSQNFLNFFVYDNIDFFPIIKDRIQFLVEKLTTACIITAQDTEELIKERKIKALISSKIVYCLEHSAARVAHNRGIPVITWQHGAYGATHHPIVNYMDLISSDFHFVFGNGVREQYFQPAKLYGTELVPIGSASLDKLKIRFSKRKHTLNSKKIVLYITSNLYQNNPYISTYPPFSDNLFWETQKAIIDILGKHNEYSIIMKLHPSSFYKDPEICSYVNDKPFKNFQFIKTEKSTIELLSLADIIVGDFPSTTLLQSLTTTKPVFVYMGHLCFDRKAYQLLENRAVCHEKLEDFVSELDDYLYNEKYSKDLFNKEFLEMFGTTSEKSLAAERAAKKLRQIIDTCNINI